MNLRQLRDILEIAVSRQEVDRGIRNWVVETREVACDIEDLLLVAVSPRKEVSIFRNFTRLFREGKALHFLEPKIQHIEKQITSLQSDIRVQNIRTCQEGSLHPVLQRSLQQRRTFSLLIGEDFVGLDEGVKELVARLMNNDGDKIYQVVSITGMGGIGKTTIAKKIYHHDVVRGHFNAFAWACISQQWQHEDVLQRILNKLEPEKKKEIKKMNYDELAEELSEVQKTKRCLIVLDDVWDVYIWNLLRCIFFTRPMNTKVLMTTRNKEIAQDKHMDVPCYVYEQRHLNDEESWELLKKKIGRSLNIPGLALEKFQGSERSVEDDGSYSRFEEEDGESSTGTFYSCISDEEEEVITLDTLRSEECNQDQRNQMHIESLAREMVAQCGGLPLAIVVLGGLLMTKATVDEWETVHQNLNSYLTRGRSFRENGMVYEVLALSYHDLPYQLQQCFLHLGNFPEDFKIPARKLYQLWSAEGFISQDYQIKEEESIMDIAERHLGELVQRCMVQVRVDEATRRFKYCQLHDLIRELCLLKGKEENFLKKVPPRYDPEIVVSPSTSAMETSASVPRRLSITVNSNFNSYYPLRHENNEHVRSAMFFSRLHHRKNLQIALDFVCNELKVLRVLDLERFNFREKLSKGIGSLVHLKYLSLRGSQFCKLPSSISNLRYLQTLDLRVPFFVPLMIPDVIWKLNNLKHLYLPPNQQCEGRLQLGTLIHLETLKNFNTRVSDYEDILKLTKLQKLAAILDLKTEHFEIFISSLKLKNRPIRDSSFRIRYDFWSEKELTILRELVGFTALRKLDLVGFINKLPDHGDFAQKLNKLILRSSELEEDPMTTLEKLPNLYSLVLRKSVFNVKEIFCTSKGFPQLRILELKELTSLECWTIEEGAMPNLFCLKIDECINLKMLPEGIKFIPTLKELVIANMPNTFKNRIQKVEGGGGGEDSHKVEHIPLITITETNSSNGRQLMQQLSGNSYSGLLKSFSPTLVPKGW